MPLDFDAPGATGTATATGTAAADPLDLPGEAVAVADEAAPEAAADENADAMPNLNEECGREIETADDSGHLASVVTEQSTCEVWACHDGTAWRYGLTWEHALGSRSSPSRLMPGDGYSTASAALGAGLSIARMDLLGKDADAVTKLVTLIDELEATTKLADEITGELQDRIDAGESEDMTPIHIVNTPVKPRSPSTPSTTLADANEILRKIAEAEAEAEAAAREVEARKADLKDAKEDYEAAINRLRRLSRQIVADASRPLLAVAESRESVTSSVTSESTRVAESAEKTAEPVTEVVTEPVANATPSSAWRDCRFDDTAEFSDDVLPASIVNKLAESSIETVGQLSDFQSKHGEFWAKEIKGIGKAKAEKISDAMIEFWSRHPEATGSK